MTSTVKIMTQSPDPSPLGLAISRATRAIQRSFDQALQSAGGNWTVWQVLRHLSDGRAETQAEVAALLGLRGPTLVHHIDSLERAGLVRRVKSANDRRAHGVEITSKGSDLHRRMLDGARAFDLRLRDAVGQDELAEFRATLGRIETAMTQQTSAGAGERR